MQQIKVRYGPSPTGIPQLGNIRTALFNYLFAKNQKGKFFLRIEDTDQARKVEGSVEKIQESLIALGLNWDGEAVFQSQRLDIYKKHLEILKEKKLAYQDEGAWRFKVDPDKKSLEWEDVVHGKVSFEAKVVEDFIIIKSDGFPTYHFASIVDDHLMEITHVFRGDEWVSSTPKHLLLYEAFGWEPPKFVHLPVILGPDKKKLSKRDGAKSVFEFLGEGYIPEAIVNFLALLGWSPKGEKEIFSLDELTNEFSLDRINKNSPIFNTEKLDWFNSQWIRRLSEVDLSKLLHKEFPTYSLETIKEYLPLVKDRMQKIQDFDKFVGPLLQENLKVDPQKIVLSKDQLQAFVDEYRNIADWSKANISAATTTIMSSQDLTKPQALGSIGTAVSGSSVTPPIYDTLEKLGKEKSIQRLENVIKSKQK